MKKKGMICRRGDYNMVKESLDFIYKQQKELSLLSGIGALLSWDQMTYMPRMGANWRSEQTALIAKWSHERIISDKLWKHITKLSEHLDELAENDQNVVKRLKKDVEKARKIPSDFVEKMTKTTTLAYTAWEEARNKNDFKVFSPHLEKIIELEKQYCDFINLPGPRYDSLLDDYEEGMTTSRLKKEFNYLKSKVVDILNEITVSDVYKEQESLKKKGFSKEKQKRICELVFEKMNLPRDRSRWDVSIHPFTTSIGYDDVRITTNFEHPNGLFSFFSMIHEAGHALYELGFPRGCYEYTVISDAASVGLHESQSRFWENMIARSEYFWKYFYKIFKENFSEEFIDINFEKWFKYVNQVKPSLIRVEADELTYPLHVILRFELETKLIDEKISVSELPVLWNEKIDELLGVTPKNDREGVLQDMHWSNGSFGYFPTYIIGTIYASQLFKTLTEENNNVLDEIEKAEFVNILNWLRENIHKYGRLMTADEIIKNVCGEGLNSKVFVNYLKNKYFTLYEV